MRNYNCGNISKETKKDDSNITIDEDKNLSILIRDKNSRN